MAEASTLSPPAAAPTPAPRRARLNPVWLALPALIFLILFMLLPVGQILMLSVTDKTGVWTTRFLEKAVSPGLYVRVLSTTFSVALQVTLWCVLLGYPLAYWLSRLRGRAQRLAAFCILLPFWTSALIKNFVWMVLLGRTGVVAQALTALGWENPPEMLYTQATVIFAMAHTMLPLAVITMLPVIQQIDRRLQPAAMTLGATGPQSFWLVTLPLSMRGISSAGLLVFVASLGFFITPALLGGPPQTMIGQLIILQINQLQNWPQGAALAAVLLVAALVSVFVFDKIFGISSVSGAGGSARRADARIRRFGLRASEIAGQLAARLGDALPEHRSRRLLNLFAGVMLAGLLVPVLAFIPMAFSAAPQLEIFPRELSLRWFEELLASPVWTGAILRSIGIGLATAALVVLVGGLAAVALARGTSRLSGPIFLLILSPMIVPPIALAVALFYLFARIGLVATNLGIVIGHCVIALPIVFVILLTTFKGYEWRLNDVAMTLGATRAQSWRLIALPLLKGGIAAGFVTGFLQSFEELTVALFIGGGLKTTLPKQMWDSILLQATPLIAAASVVMLVIVMAFFALLELAQTRRGLKPRP